MMTRTITLTVALAVLVLGACSADKPDSTALSVAEQIQQRSASRSQPLYSTFDEAMPNINYVIDGSVETKASDLYIRGTVIAVDPGKSFRWELDDSGENEQRFEIDYNAEGAMVSTVHLTVRPNRIITGDHTSSPSGDVVIALALNSPLDVPAVKKEFIDYGTIAAVLLDDSPVFDYQDNLWAILEDGALFAVVNDEGILNFPAIDAADRSRLVPESITVSSLESADNSRTIFITTTVG